MIEVDKDIDKEKDKDSIGRNGKLSFGEFNKVFLKPEEKEKLTARLGESEVLSLIDALDRSIEAQPKKYSYSNHYAVILKWSARNKESEKAKEMPLGRAHELKPGEKDFYHDTN